ncbi:phage tail tape measure protein [Rhodococcus pyridinivorans]|nr:phage tail tape measure protein [Rhodococcus pyridinivorans]UGQ58963.1 phage tail tape measure protein [Rhodococcus pyridinivorans]
MVGGRIDIEVGADVSRFPADLEKGMKGAVGVATKVVASSARPRCVRLHEGCSRPGQQLHEQHQRDAGRFGCDCGTVDAVREAAKGLGNDATIADTSATDAAAAMTELAKGGFSVDQSMSAARGTLQLAAAAQIEAAQAATIQSQALQAFGLDADYAAKAADVLANGANARLRRSPMSQLVCSRPVPSPTSSVCPSRTPSPGSACSPTPVSGVDAGTLLKSALLALTDQGKPARPRSKSSADCLRRAGTVRRLP